MQHNIISPSSGAERLTEVHYNKFDKSEYFVEI